MIISLTGAKFIKNNKKFEQTSVAPRKKPKSETSFLFDTVQLTKFLMIPLRSQLC